MGKPPIGKPFSLIVCFEPFEKMVWEIPKIFFLPANYLIGKRKGCTDYSEKESSADIFQKKTAG